MVTDVATATVIAFSSISVRLVFRRRRAAPFGNRVVRPAQAPTVLQTHRSTTCASFTLSLPSAVTASGPSCKPVRRLAVDPHSELFIRPDGMTQAGPDPVSETAKPIPSPPKLVA
jgi:hypothetical protein